MYRTGHYGAALLVYAPLGLLLLASGHEALALTGVGIVVGGSMIPDWDQKLPLLSHRGVTHTVWFAILFGATLGGGSWLLAQDLGLAARAGLVAFGFAVGTLTVLAHILADALTPMGVRPFAPFGSTPVSFGLTRASNPIANGLLLLIGLGVAGGAFIVSHHITVGIP